MMKRKALTFLEVLLVVAVFFLIVGATLPQTLKLFFTNDIEIANQELLHTLRRANVQATRQVQDNSWGVQFDSSANSYTFFAGTGYASRTTSFDKVTELPASVAFGTISLNGGGTGVIFDQLTGETSQYGTVQLTSETADNVTISINSLGHVSIQ